MRTAANVQLIKYLDVAVVDRAIYFPCEAWAACRKLGIKNFYYVRSLKDAAKFIDEESMDVLFLEVSRTYDPIWKMIRAKPSLRTVIVGSTCERTGRTWLSALRAGADRVILKQQASTVLEPMLVHLLEGEAARRFRVVPLAAVAGSAKP